MPPKAKFTKEQIVNAALDLIRERGTAELTARALGKKLGSSACPIFTVFENMEEVWRETVKAAKAVYTEYVERGLREELAFRGVGMQYLAFALQEPKLFQLLFMGEQPQKPSANNVLPIIEEHYEKILQSVQDNYGLRREDAEKLYRHLWIYTHGIAALSATKTCLFTPQEIGTMMTELLMSVLKEIKGARHD